MKVILQENVQKLGNAGDVVDISRGYFRNFLEPRKLAVMATPGTLKKREEDREALKRKVDKALAEARELADRVSKLPPLRIEAKAGESGKLYGKVTNKEVGVVLDKALETNIDKRIIKILGDVSTLGSYKVQVKLAPEIQAECT
ncbi:MAG: 50S ribosomal protein L9, partial [Cyanobacteria bacterium]|nr:50S ribosomal protein L9 [Cyanobacteriota bacterium]